jgi:hypothetical protein
MSDDMGKLLMLPGAQVRLPLPKRKMQKDMLEPPHRPTEAQQKSFEEWIYGATGGEGCIVADGFEFAFVGVMDGPDEAHPYRAVYDTLTCIHILRLQGMTEEEAAEYFDFNVLGANVGPGTPVFIHTSQGSFAYAHFNAVIEGFKALVAKKKHKPEKK